jgi:hypothetical protein
MPVVCASAREYTLTDEYAALQIMTAKPITWRVKTADDSAATPGWERLDAAPASVAELHGELRIENDDQIMLVFFADEAAQERVTRAARDAASLAQEWQIPHKPASSSQS